MYIYICPPPLASQYLYFCTSKASKLSKLSTCPRPPAHPRPRLAQTPATSFASVFVLWY